MSSEQSTIQSLKAVDQWIDVINANINGGVRTGFFMVASPNMFDFNNAAGNVEYGKTISQPNGKFYLTRDGEFHTDSKGFLVTSYGYYLVPIDVGVAGGKLMIDYDTLSNFGSAGSGIGAVFNDLDNPAGPLDSTGVASGFPKVQLLSDFLNMKATDPAFTSTPTMLLNVTNGLQNLKYSQFGSTVFDFGFKVQTTFTNTEFDPNTGIAVVTSADATILSKSLEASNASMTQSVPELSLAQKLFSALTKVLQITQTNTDSVLNLIR